MKTKLSADYTSPAILVVTTLGILVGSPILLGIGFFAFCLDSTLTKFKFSAMEATSYLKDIQIAQLQDQLEAKKSNE
ncbi:hypothetical protein [Nostoc sp.]|uniref:hypothetical protein n=1 Tax=Nostoc sp. TaxID=1180 RepID=UPI002FFB68B9